MDIFWLVIEILAAIVQPVGPAPRYCPQGQEYWTEYDFMETRLFADSSFIGIENPDLYPYVVSQGCDSGETLERFIIAALEYEGEGKLIVKFEDGVESVVQMP